MSYNKQTSIRATRGEETTFDELHSSPSKLKSLINALIACAISLSLILAFTPLTSVGSAFAEEPETPGVTDANKITVTYEVKNGSWNNGETKAVEETVTLIGNDGQPAADGTATLTPPEVGDNPAQNYKAEGSWSPELPTNNEITATNAPDGAIIYTYTYAAKTQYTVTFDTDGGSAVASQTVYEGDNAIKPATDPTKEGHTFGGWLLDGTAYNFDKPVNGNITLTAKWNPVTTPEPEKHEITVTYEVKNGTWADGSTGSQSVKVEVTGDQTTALPQPPVALGNPYQHYKTGAWNTSNGTLPSTISIADATDGKIVYTYTFVEKQQFTIIFDTNGGAPAPEKQFVYEGDCATKPANPTKEAMSFDYWMTSDGVAYDFNTPVSANLTLTAKWVAASGQWKSNSQGKWYQYGDGNYIKSDWLSDNGKKYYFDSEGWMVTGWKEIEDSDNKVKSWYYFEPSGAMATGWKLLNGAWYYMNTTSGIMNANDQYVISGKSYYFDKNGAMQTGWINSGAAGNPVWRYFDGSGAMATGWRYVGSAWYYLDPSTGIMVTGDQTIDKKNYLFANSGAMQTGWKKTSNNWCYYEGSGAMAISKWVLVGSAWYYMDADGVMKTGQFSDGRANYYANASGAMVTGWVSTSGHWYYYGPSGAMQTGWQYVGGAWYYMDADGVMKTGQFSDGKTNYCANASGAMQTGWVNTGTSSAPVWYYYGPSGAMMTGWQYVNGAWYYMNPDNDGIMATGQFNDGKTNYYANASGAMQTGWVNTGTSSAPVWYYYGPSGAMLTNAWAGDYWLGADGIMVTDKWVDNDKYYVGSDGKWDSSKKPTTGSDSKPKTE